MLSVLHLEVSKIKIFGGGKVREGRSSWPEVAWELGWRGNLASSGPSRGRTWSRWNGRSTSSTIRVEFTEADTISVVRMCKAQQ